MDAAAEKKSKSEMIHTPAKKEGMDKYNYNTLNTLDLLLAVVVLCILLLWEVVLRCLEWNCQWPTEVVISMSPGLNVRKHGKVVIGYSVPQYLFLCDSPEYNLTGVAKFCLPLAALSLSQ